MLWHLLKARILFQNALKYLCPFILKKKKKLGKASLEQMNTGKSALNGESIDL